MAGSSDVDLVKAMMIILPIMSGLYYPVYFSSLALSCDAAGVEFAMTLSIISICFGQTLIPSVMGVISDSQTAVAYSYAYIFLGCFVLIGALVSIAIVILDLRGSRK